MEDASHMNDAAIQPNADEIQQNADDSIADNGKSR